MRRRRRIRWAHCLLLLRFLLSPRRPRAGGRRGLAGLDPRPERRPLDQAAFRAGRRLPRAVPLETQRVRRGGGADARQHLGARPRHDRRQEHGGQPHRLAHVVELPVQLRGACRIPGHHPRFDVRDVLVGGVHDPERGSHALVQREAIHRLPIARHRRRRRGSERAGRAGRGHQPPLPVAVGHRDDARDEIAEVVREVDVVAILEPLPGEVAVLTVGNLLGQVQPQRIRSQALDRLQRIHGRAERLAHLLALPVDPAVSEHLPRQRDAGAHQHRGPDDAVEAGDVLADHVQVGRPPGVEQRVVGAVADARDVVDQRVHPDVDHAAGIGRNRYAPRLPGPAHGDVLEAGLEQPQDLVAADLRLERLRVRRVALEQGLAILRQAEEVVLLAYPLRRALVHRAGAVDEVLLLLERLARDAVPPFVEPLVDVARLDQARDERRHAAPVAIFRSPDEVVEGNVQPPPDVPERGLHPVAEGQRREPLLARALVHVLRVLVVSHQEPRIEAGEPLVARDDVGGHLLVRRAQVRPAVHVVDGGGEVEAGHASDPDTPSLR